MNIRHFITLSLLSIGCTSTDLLGQEHSVTVENDGQTELVIQISRISYEGHQGGKELPQPIANVIRTVDVSRVQVLGGQAIPPQEWETKALLPKSNPILESQVHEIAEQTGNSIEPTRADSQGGFSSVLMVPLTKEQRQTLLDAAKGNHRNNITQAATMTLCAGQSATIIDGTHRMVGRRLLDDW